MIPWHYQPMKRTKNRIISMNCIEKWMKSNGLTIPLVASKCGIPESIVRNWISQKEIPVKFANCLQELIAGSHEAPIKCIGGNCDEGLKFDISLTDYSKLCRKAMESGCSVNELIAHEIDSLGNPS